MTLTSTPPPTQPAAPETPRSGRAALITFRTTSIAFVLWTVLQGAWAGLFITGDVGMLKVHALSGNALSGLSVLVAVATVWTWRTRRTSVWPLPTSVVLMACLGVEGAVGRSRALAVHLPLALVIMTLGTVLAAWSFAAAPRRKATAE
jgi:hypothetical protein